MQSARKWGKTREEKEEAETSSDWLYELYDDMTNRVAKSRASRPPPAVVAVKEEEKERKIVERVPPEDVKIREDAQYDATRLIADKLSEIGFFSSSAAAAAAGAEGEQNKKATLDGVYRMLTGRRRAGDVGDDALGVLARPPEDLAREFAKIAADGNTVVLNNVMGDKSPYFRTIAVFSGGVVVASGLIMSYRLGVLRTVVSESLMSMFRAIGMLPLDFVFPIITASYQAIKSDAPSKEKLEFLLGSAVRAAVSSLAGSGTRLLMGGLVLGPMGTVLGIVVASAVMAATGMLTDVVLERFHILPEGFENIVAVNAVNSEASAIEYRRDLRNLERLDGVPVTGMGYLQHAIDLVASHEELSRGALCAAATMTVMTEVFNPVQISRWMLDKLVDYGAIRMIIIPYIIRTFAKIAGTERFRRSMHVSASLPMKLFKKYYGEGQLTGLVDKMQTHWAFIAAEKLIGQIILTSMTQFLQMGLTTARVRDTMRSAYIKSWGKPMEITRASNPFDVGGTIDLEDLGHKIDTTREMLAQGKGGPNVARNLRWMESVMRHEKAMAGLLDGDTITATTQAYADELERARTGYANACNELAIKRLYSMTEKDFSKLQKDPGSTVDLALIASYMRGKDGVPLKFDEILEWRRANVGWMNRLGNVLMGSESELAKNEKAWMAKLTFAEQSVRASLVAQAQIVTAGKATLEELLKDDRVLDRKTLEAYSASYARMMDYRMDEQMDIYETLDRISQPGVDLKKLDERDLSNVGVFMIKTGAPFDAKKIEEWLKTIPPDTIKQWGELAKLSRNSRTLPPLQFLPPPEEGIAAPPPKAGEQKKRGGIYRYVKQVTRPPPVIGTPASNDLHPTDVGGVAIPPGSPPPATSMPEPTLRDAINDKINGMMSEMMDNAIRQAQRMRMSVNEAYSIIGPTLYNTESIAVHMATTAYTIPVEQQLPPPRKEQPQQHPEKPRTTAAEEVPGFPMGTYAPPLLGLEKTKQRAGIWAFEASTKLFISVVFPGVGTTAAGTLQAIEVAGKMLIESSRVSTAQATLVELGKDILAEDISKLTGKRRNDALLAHEALAALYKHCFASTLYSFQDILQTESPCARLESVGINLADIAKMLPLLKNIFGEGVNAESLKGLSWKLLKGVTKEYWAQTQEWKNAVDVLTYGSDTGPGSWLYSIRQLQAYGDPAHYSRR